MPQSFNTILIEQESGLATLTLNRPQIHNAFNDEMILELTRAFKELSGDVQTKLVLLTGAGNSFCAGADLNWMKKMAGYEFDKNVEDAKQLHQLLLTVYECPKPVVAHVNGSAIGGGVGLVAAVDMAYADEEAQFGFSEVRLGLIPAVISPFVIRKIGEANAREFFLTGERFSAQKARHMGLIQEMGSPEDLEEILFRKISALKKGGAEALSECKKLIHNVEGVPLAKVGSETARYIAERRASDEGQKGMEAFLNKRNPPWVKS